ncbi:hypothetical protein, partial [Actinoallomurus sp. NPDC052274]|uniref:hypothetical protein n=1 Tax=Actinoallomurus sp. NPDC052274 TaxID=3155420 RepID=UPI003423870D
ITQRLPEIGISAGQCPYFELPTSRTGVNADEKALLSGMAPVIDSRLGGEPVGGGVRRAHRDEQPPMRRAVTRSTS